MSKKYEYLFLDSELELVDEKHFDNDEDAIEHAHTLLSECSHIIACKVVSEVNRAKLRDAAVL